MIETPARILRIEGESAWVVSEAPSSCGACAGKGCGSSVFNRLWHPDAQEYAVGNPIQARPGDAVVVGIPDGTLLRATLLGYLAPLASVLTGAALGGWIAGDSGTRDIAAATGGLAGLIIAALWLKLRPTLQGNAQTEPVILRLGSTSCSRSAAT